MLLFNTVYKNGLLWKRNGHIFVGKKKYFSRINANLSRINAKLSRINAKLLVSKLAKREFS